MKKRFLIPFAFFFIAAHTLGAQSRIEEFNFDLKYMSIANIAFERQDYSEAMKYAQLAKSHRKEKIQYEVNLLENSFKPAEVKYAGDSIAESLPILRERQDTDAIEIIEWYKKNDAEPNYEDSKKRLIAYIRTTESFPEADFLMGKIYKLEGEYDFALTFYKNALENSFNLSIPDEKYDILYEMAGVSYVKGDFDQYEKDLLLVLAQDKSFRDETLLNAINNTISSNKKNCMEKYFQLYRNPNAKTLKAYFDIAEYYRTQKEFRKALDASSVGIITAFTKINDVMAKRNPEYEYTNLRGFFSELLNYSDIIEWGIKNDVWKGFYNFAEDAYTEKKLTFTLQLLNVLKDCSPEEYWKEKAAVRLAELLG